jgi:hypothetical protein
VIPSGKTPSAKSLEAVANQVETERELDIVVASAEDPLVADRPSQLFPLGRPPVACSSR